MTVAVMPLSHLKLSDGEFTNPRTKSGLDDGSIRELAVSIGEHGLLVPLRVRADGVILAGQRRFRAMTMLATDPVGIAKSSEPPWNERLFIQRANDLKTNGVVVLVDDSENDDGVALVDNLMRSDLSTYETAAKLAQIRDGGFRLSNSDIAKKVGRSRSWVQRMLSAWDGSSDAVKDLWRSGEMTLSEIEEMGAPRSRRGRGAANRPGIDSVQELLTRAREKYRNEYENMPPDYEHGIIDALSWVTGNNEPSKYFSMKTDGMIPKVGGEQ